MKLSVVIPCYNEVATIAAVLDAVRRVPETSEVIVVDDCSTDGTGDLLRGELAQRIDRLVCHPVNRGKGAALRSGIAEASGDIVVIQDADLEYDPQQYDRLTAPIRQGRADVVYGSRFMGAEPHRVLYFWHRVGNGFLTLMSKATVLWAIPRSSGRIRILTITAVTLAVFYIGFLFVSISLFDYYTPLDQRILVPAFVLSLIAIAAALSSVVQSHRIAGRVAMVLVTLFVLVGLPQYAQQLSAHTHQGVGYFSRAIRQTPILSFVGKSQFPLVYSNAPELIEIYFGGTARMLPNRWDPAANRPRPEFDAEMTEMRRAVEQVGAALVYFRAFAWRSYLPSREDLEQISGLTDLYSEADGTVLVASPEPGS